MNRAYVGVGSNIGNKKENILSAVREIEKKGIRILRLSNLYETEPYGNVEQASFINGAIELETELNCHELLALLLDIENILGRVRTVKWGPRIIDLDIEFFNDEIYNEEFLKVPHPDMQNRIFVLKPLMDLCPDYIHPIIKKSITQLTQSLLDRDSSPQI